ncbi:hypothetical protein BKA70DRAFT_1300990 [Coprinopsis sp. MPI-PUGE-AT-0042]|nr:hypothetical protein BKA70DRAFT_1300990 [Coprinopsis sp. MPI-PUGE-AT-0042]
MRFSLPSLLFTLVGCAVVNAIPVEVSNSDVSATTWPKLWPPKVCDFNAKGPLLPQMQEAAIKDFGTEWLLNYNIDLAFDRWAPGPEFIEHHPIGPPSGREWGIEYLKANFPKGKVTNLTIIAGNGEGILHYKFNSPAVNFAEVHLFRFKGTCIVEHWDVIQTITGTEPNPKAFF